VSDETNPNQPADAAQADPRKALREALSEIDREERAVVADPLHDPLKAARDASAEAARTAQAAIFATDKPTPERQREHGLDATTDTDKRAFGRWALHFFKGF
jgi:hypothetical protein